MGLQRPLHVCNRDNGREQVGPAGRSAATADRFDEWLMASRAAPALPVQQAAICIREESAKAFDPECVRAFNGAFGPIRTPAMMELEAGAGRA